MVRIIFNHNHVRKQSNVMFYENQHVLYSFFYGFRPSGIGGTVSLSDANGIMRLTDNIYSVPVEFRSQLETFSTLESIPDEMDIQPLQRIVAEPEKPATPEKLILPKTAKETTALSEKQVYEPLPVEKTAAKTETTDTDIRKPADPEKIDQKTDSAITARKAYKSKKISIEKASRQQPESPDMKPDKRLTIKPEPGALPQAGDATEAKQTIPDETIAAALKKSETKTDSQLPSKEVTTEKPSATKPVAPKPVNKKITQKTAPVEPEHKTDVTKTGSKETGKPATAGSGKTDSAVENVSVKAPEIPLITSPQPATKTLEKDIAKKDTISASPELPASPPIESTKKAVSTPQTLKSATLTEKTRSLFSQKPQTETTPEVKEAPPEEKTVLKADKPQAAKQGAPEISFVKKEAEKETIKPIRTKSAPDEMPPAPEQKERFVYKTKPDKKAASGESKSSEEKNRLTDQNHLSDAIKPDTVTAAITPADTSSAKKESPTVKRPVAPQNAIERVPASEPYSGKKMPDIKAPLPATGSLLQKEQQIREETVKTGEAGNIRPSLSMDDSLLKAPEPEKQLQAEDTAKASDAPSPENAALDLAALQSTRNCWLKKKKH